MKMLQACSPPSEPVTAPYRHLPGDLAMWFFILVELAVFGLLLIGLVVARSHEPEIFAAGARTLHTTFGLINTLILLTGSYCVARAVTAIRAGSLPTCTHWLWAGAASGVAYVAIKLTEYGGLIEAGYTLRSSTFYFFYFFVTFFHLMHVVLGMIILLAVARRCRHDTYREDPARGVGAVESGASYWHMVDLVWLVLFPIVYVLM
ncbi:cytochrome c oxidase subunit 3 family protein [Halomonas shantousis]